MFNYKTGVLLVNLGTPDSAQPKDVYRYLIEFLTDGRVIDLPWLKRQLLVRGLIVPSRYRQSASSYQMIWSEKGSPLMVYGEKVKDLVQQKLGGEAVVELAMRYQNPSIKSTLASLMRQPIDHLIIFPLFPQYASATTGSIFEEVMKSLAAYPQLPKLSFVDQFAIHPSFIKAFVKIGSQYALEDYDHVLFSFHGLPQKHVIKADRGQWCLKEKACCQTYCDANRHCYSSQCYATAKLIAEGLNLTSSQYTVAFQSRLGKDPWLQPYASETIEKLAHQKKKNLLVFSPSFVCDCLETIYEIGIEYQQEFKKFGGEKLTLVRGLNDEEAWIDAIIDILHPYLQTLNPLAQNATSASPDK